MTLAADRDEIASRFIKSKRLSEINFISQTKKIEVKGLELR